VRAELDAGAGGMARNWICRTPLYHAASNGIAESIQALLDVTVSRVGDTN